MARATASYAAGLLLLLVSMAMFAQADYMCPKKGKYSSIEVYKLSKGGKYYPPPVKYYEPGTTHYYKELLVSYYNKGYYEVGYAYGTATVYEYYTYGKYYTYAKYTVNTYDFKGYGTITTQGDFVEGKGKSGIQAITGGTGKYKGAAGELYWYAEVPGEKVKLVFKLLTPYDC